MAQLLLGEDDDAALALDEAVAFEGVVHLLHAPLLRAGAELGLRALRAAGVHAEAPRVLRPLRRGPQIAVHHLERVRVEPEVEIGEVLVVVVLHQLEVNGVARGLERDDDGDVVLHLVEHGRQAVDGLRVRRLHADPDLRGEVLRELAERLERLAGAGAAEIEAVDDHDVRVEVRDVARERDCLQDAGDARHPAAERRGSRLGLPEVREDQAAALHVEAHALRIFEPLEDGDVVKNLVVVGADVIHGVLVRDVEDLPLAQQIVEADLHEHRSLPDAGPRGDDADVAAPEPTVHRALEDPHRAPLIDFASVHRRPHFPFSFLSCSSRCFLMSSSASAAGSGR